MEHEHGGGGGRGRARGGGRGPGRGGYGGGGGGYGGGGGGGYDSYGGGDGRGGGRGAYIGGEGRGGYGHRGRGGGYGGGGGEGRGGGYGGGGGEGRGGSYGGGRGGYGGGGGGGGGYGGGGRGGRGPGDGGGGGRGYGRGGDAWAPTGGGRGGGRGEYAPVARTPATQRIEAQEASSSSGSVGAIRKNRTSELARSPQPAPSPQTMTAAIHKLDPSDELAGRVVDDIVRLEKRIFPKHESLVRSFHDELRRRNSGLIYSTLCIDGYDGCGEEVIGYAMYTCATTLCASITKLAVKESCRRQGHGEALLAAAVESCRRLRVRRVSLHVDPARAAAVALYRKVGFQVDATIHGYYSPQGDAYRMYLDL